MLQKIIKLVAKITTFRLTDSEKLQNIKMQISNWKAKAMDDLHKFSFYFLAISALVLIIFNTGYFFIKRSSNTYAGVNAGQVVLVNIESDDIVVGNVIQDQIVQAEKEEAVEKIKDKFDVEKIEQAKKEKEIKEKIFKAKVEEVDLKKAKVALVVRDLGLSKSLTLNTLDMEPSLTLGFTPYSVDIKNWIDQAINKGFEVLVNIPMQPSDYPVNDPGPYAMINNLSKGENVTRFNWISLRSDKIAGYYTNEDETFSNSRSNFMPILERIKEDRRYLVFGNSSNTNGALTLSDNLELDMRPVSNVIDTVLEEEKIRNKLLLLEAEAMRKGYAVGFLNPYPISLRVVNQWMGEIDSNKLAVVPVSAIFKSLHKEKKPKVPKVDESRKLLEKKAEPKDKADENDSKNVESNKVEKVVKKKVDER